MLDNTYPLEVSLAEPELKSSLLGMIGGGRGTDLGTAVWTSAGGVSSAGT